MEKNTKDTTDRISMLPEFIVHHILSYLRNDPKSRVRMSVLSKEWFALTASCPILDFHLGACRRNVCFRGLETFYRYVEYTVSRFCEQNISAHTLDISTKFLYLEQLELVGHCLELVIEKGVQVLVIDVGYWDKNLPLFRLPNTLLSASSLTSLTLHKCELPSSLMVGVVKFKSLRLLSLSYLPIDEGVIEYLTKGCPLLEEIYLVRCYGFKTFCVKRHQNLLKVVIFCNERLLLERIDVEAPNLSYFLLDISNKYKAPSMFLGLCKKFTTFCCRGFPLKNNNDFLSNFPFLENVVLDFPSPVNNLKLSNHSLREIRLQSYCDLEEIDLNEPNLLLFEYRDQIYFHNFAPLSRKHSSMSKGCMECETTEYFDILWFEKLRKFLDKNSIFKVLKLVIQWMLIDVEEIKKLIDVKEIKLMQSPTYEPEHVDLVNTCYIRESSVYVALVDAVLWCFRPRSLTIELDLATYKCDVVKYTYAKLLQQEDEGQTNIKFVLISTSKREQQFRDLNSLLEALSLDYFRRKITFIKEEAVQDAG